MRFIISSVEHSDTISPGAIVNPIAPTYSRGYTSTYADGIDTRLLDCATGSAMDPWHAAEHCQERRFD